MSDKLQLILLGWNLRDMEYRIWKLVIKSKPALSSMQIHELKYTKLLFRMDTTNQTNNAQCTLKPGAQTGRHSIQGPKRNKPKNTSKARTQLSPLVVRHINIMAILRMKVTRPDHFLRTGYPSFSYGIKDCSIQTKLSMWVCTERPVEKIKK